MDFGPKLEEVRILTALLILSVMSTLFSSHSLINCSPNTSASCMKSKKFLTTHVYAKIYTVYTAWNVHSLRIIDKSCSVLSKTLQLTYFNNNWCVDTYPKLLTTMTQSWYFVVYHRVNGWREIAHAPPVIVNKLGFFTKRWLGKKSVLIQL